MVKLVILSFLVILIIHHLLIMLLVFESFNQVSDPLLTILISQHFLINKQINYNPQEVSISLNPYFIKLLNNLFNKTSFLV